MKKSLLKIKALLLVLILAGVAIAPAQEIVPQTQTVLKSYFGPGLRPADTNYYELIDTMFWYVNQTYANSLAAAQAAQANTSFNLGWVNFTLNTATNVQAVLNNSYNIASVTVTNLGSTTFLVNAGSSQSLNNYLCTLTFSNTIAGSNYRFRFSSPATVTNLNAANWTTGVLLQGLGATTNGTSVPAMTFSTTNCSFYFFSDHTANLNGVNTAVVIQ